MTKRIPNLQVALDHSDLQGAIKAAVAGHGGYHRSCLPTK